MSEATMTADVKTQDGQLEFLVKGDHHPQNGTLLGFWLYLMSDCLIFAALFATYGVLARSYAGGPTGIAARQHPVGSEQGGEDQAVAHQVEPEAQQRTVLGVVIPLHQKLQLAILRFHVSGHGCFRHWQAPWFVRLQSVLLPPRGCSSHGRN